jgi:thiamine-phosphate diphosphorylase / hydroxyethylthiazole kinase
VDSALDDTSQYTRVRERFPDEMATHTKKKKLNLTLYLVTDSTPTILGDKDLVWVVDEAIKGGVTIVQYRDKHADTGRLIEVASKLHAVTKRHKVPLLINDRLDVCLAIGADGVHLGQDDMSASLARSLLGPDAIIGVSAASVEEASAAIDADADYLGIGTMFATPTKTDVKSIIGTQGTQAILAACSTGTSYTVPCVAIGSINASNVQRVLHQSADEENRLNGVAVVSAIMASSNPQGAARELRSLIDSTNTIYNVATTPDQNISKDLPQLTARLSSIVSAHVDSSVLCHNMTNTVVQNFAANVCLATGSSPIMSLNGPEALDLAKLGGALVINMGTVTPDIIEVYLAGMRAYNAAGNPVLFDPVGGGATSVRKDAMKQLLSGGFFSVIKGNEGEIGAVAGSSTVQQRGVDSGPSTSSAHEKASLVRMLARRERCIVLMTGSTDFLSDGDRTVTIGNGCHWLGKITGSGCALGSVIAGYLAVHREDKFLAALAGILHYEIAAERADRRCHGPGTFIPAFLDELHLLGQEIKQGKSMLPEDALQLQWL